MTAGDASFVLFTELYTRVARSDLRIFFNLLPFSFSSDQFKISAGRLNSLEVLPDPSAVSLRILWSTIHGALVHIHIHVHSVYTDLLMNKGSHVILVCLPAISSLTYKIAHIHVR